MDLAIVGEELAQLVGASERHDRHQTEQLLVGQRFQVRAVCTGLDQFIDEFATTSTAPQSKIVF